MKDYKFELLSEKERQAIIANNKRKVQNKRLRNIRNSSIAIIVFLVIPSLLIRHRVILAEKCSKLSYEDRTDITHEECGNLYFQTYEYWTPTGGKQRTIEPPEKWCTYNLKGTKYTAPCPTPSERY